MKHSDAKTKQFEASKHHFDAHTLRMEAKTTHLKPK